jgi:hypothetical protein
MYLETLMAPYAPCAFPSSLPPLPYTSAIAAGHIWRNKHTVATGAYKTSTSETKPRIPRYGFNL